MVCPNIKGPVPKCSHSPTSSASEEWICRTLASCKLFASKKVEKHFGKLKSLGCTNKIEYAWSGNLVLRRTFRIANSNQCN